jgi:hypothetical protein
MEALEEGLRFGGEFRIDDGVHSMWSCRSRGSVDVQKL